MFSLLKSIPVAVLLGTANVVGATRAWISTSIGLVPSIVQTIAVPGAPTLCSDSRILDGLLTSIKPLSVISKTPSSFVEPKRFFTALIIL